jgi:two-component system sensor histidine kinase KdpD
MTRLEGGVFRLSISLCDIQDLIGVCLSRFAVQAKDHPIDVRLTEPLPMLMLDERLMVQVLLNLLDNAVKYSPENIPIEITVSQTKDSLVVRVADSGVGIPETDLDRIFDRFYRSERAHAYQGIGLGLSISRGIIEAHGGKIWAEHRRPRGTILCFSLPLSTARLMTDVNQ